VTVTLSGIFLIYLTVFLAVVLIAWLSYLWQRRRSVLPQKRQLICSVCGALINQDFPRLRVKCSGCGAVQESGQLKEK
jgi:hypothetical protein